MSYYYVAGLPCSNELYHHGIIGQKWGVRRFQNRDGSLTAEGRIRYGGKESTGEKVKKAVVNAGRVVGSTAKKTGAAVGKASTATANYIGKRFKMNHPSLMSDQELKDYTQRLIAEQNYSRMMSQLDSPSMAGHASRLVRNLLHDTAGIPFAVVRGIGGTAGDMLKRGANTLADAGFRKIAQEMTKSKLERENDKLNQEVRKNEFLEKLNPKKESGLDYAKRVMNDPNASADDIAKASTVLKNYRQAKTNIGSLFSSDGGSSSAPPPSSTESKAAELVSKVISEPSSSTDVHYRMRPLETMGDLGSRSGASTREITYDPPRTGDFDSIRFIPGTPRKRKTSRVSSGDWRHGL